MYKYLLFDADNTLLDFDAAEAQALRETLSLCPLGFSDEVHRRYHIINDLEWKRLERGETTRERLRVERFEKLYCEFGMDGSRYGKSTADIYADKLSMQGQMMEDAEKVLKALSAKYKCYVVTNGITDIQKSRMSRTPLEKYIEHSFISQEMGCSKPEPAFFRKVFEYIGDSDTSKYLVIGDSPTSDIAGANSVGVESVLISNNDRNAATYRIEKLYQLLSILD